MGRVLLLGLIAVSLFVAIGCIDPQIPPTTPPVEWQNPTNPKIVLENLEWCYNNAMYYDRYETLIHDSFTFYFSERDQGQGLPATYNKVEDLQSTQSLFENDAIGAQNIDLTLAIPENYLPPADDETTERMSHIPYDLYVTIPAESMTYHAQHTASFELTRQDDAGSDQARWYIGKWWDEVQ
ncbi:hypothetical protein K8R78_01185 [bacterium]|nr:hypothetical protein [bacterium]